MTSEKPFAKGATSPFATQEELTQSIIKGNIRIYNSPEEVRSRS